MQNIRGSEPPEPSANMGQLLGGPLFTKDPSPRALHNDHFRITHRLPPTQKWSNAIVHTSDNIIHSSLSFLFFPSKPSRFTQNPPTKERTIDSRVIQPERQVHAHAMTWLPATVSVGWTQSSPQAIPFKRSTSRCQLHSFILLSDLCAKLWGLRTVISVAWC